ncbi:MAG: leucine-rich repeat protein [Clostridia bacterium]|nr:leucine-rich repeat protein [Clostridia bacterium]
MDKNLTNKKPKKIFLKTVLVYLLILVVPFALFFTVARLSGNVFSDSFTAALADKYDLVRQTEGQKIVWIGGSSLPFGLRGDLVEEHLHVKSVDMGVYAAVGTKAMLEITLDGIRAGDLVILAPELSTQTYSDYFNADVFWEAAYEQPKMIPCLSFGEQAELFYHYFPFAWARITQKDTAGAAGSLYARNSFDERGDLSYPHTGNRMAGGVDKSQPISLDGLLTGAFYETVVPFIDACKSKGADVYFTFSPTNEAAKSFTDAEEAAFLSELNGKLPCPVLGSPSEMTYGSAYFYNTNYHLNETGAVLHTKTLLEEILKALSLPSDTGIVVPYIPPDELPEPDPQPGDEQTDLSFRMERAGGAYYLAKVIGSAAEQTELTLPKTYRGQPVAGIESGAFDDCTALQKLFIPDNYSIFPPYLFTSCPQLSEIHFAHTDPSVVSIPVSGMFDGGSPGLTVYLPADAYTKFASDYTWRIYRSLFKRENAE